MTTDQIQKLIEDALPGASAEVRGSEGKFEALVISPAFEGLSTVKQHQMVYAAVSEPIASGELHALTIKTATPKT